MKTINRNEIIESVVRMACDSKRIDWWIVKDVLDSLDFVIYQYLNDSLAREPYEDIRIKLVDGIYIDRKYVAEHIPHKGIFKGKTILEHYNIKAHVSEYYSKKVNDKAAKNTFKTKN